MPDIREIIDRYGLPRGKGYIYVTEAAELYAPGAALKDIYARIAAAHGTSVGAVAKNVSLCVCAAEMPPKEFLATVKEIFDRISEGVST